MHTKRHTRSDVATATDGTSDREARATVDIPPPFVYELDDVTIEVDMHRHRNAPRGLVRSLVLVFKKGTLDGFKLHGFSVWSDQRSDERKVRYPSREWQTPGEGHKRPWDLLRGSQKNDFTPHRRLDRLILDAIDAAPPIEVTIG